MTTLCDCGARATCETQIDWDSRANSGVYESLCEECYSSTPEAQVHQREYYSLMRYVRDGRCIRGEDGIWRGPHGQCHHDADYTRMLAALATADPAEVEDAIHSLDRGYGSQRVAPPASTYRY